METRKKTTRFNYLLHPSSDGRMGGIKIRDCVRRYVDFACEMLVVIEIKDYGMKRNIFCSRGPLTASSVYRVQL